MRIKTKLTLGVGLLFLLISLLGLVGAVYINAMKSDTESILEDNYNTIEYARNMLSAIDNKTSEASQKFELNLQKQENTITEIGEKELTAELRKRFNLYQSEKADTNALPVIRQVLFSIMDLNMEAIQRKSNLASKTAETATLWIAVTGIACFLIAFILLINLPSSIANPIRDLTNSIKQIASKKYSERVHFESHNEFGDLARSFNTMAQKLEEYDNSNLARLMMEKKRIETLINNMHDPVIGLDENLKIIFVNEEAVKIIGLPQNQLIGHSTKDIAVRNDLIRMLIQNLVADLEQTDAIPKEKAIKIYADGKESYFEKETLDITIFPTGEKERILIGHVVILRNVTEYKELDFAKTNFIATVSHEFKTPIASIKMSLQLLENERVGMLNEEQRNLVNSITDDTGRLLKITGELLNLTQVESGNIQLSIIPADPKSIFDHAIHANKTLAEQKSITLETHYDENLPKVQADSDKTVWVLTNLISNAIRYSHEHSSIQLSITEENHQLHFAVQDTGRGIPPQYKDKVFDRYFRVPGTNKEGTGLGLAISKEFIEAQSGTITVATELGEGSTFTVILNSWEQ
jgi:NtrC-family two-component system sensor histidine kinase KinB